MDSPHDTELSATSRQEENKAPEMAYDPTQETYWDNATFPQQSLGTELLENSLFEPLSLTVCGLQAQEERFEHQSSG
jgi:hypothetical protein